VGGVGLTSLLLIDLYMKKSFSSVALSGLTIFLSVVLLASGARGAVTLTTLYSFPGTNNGYRPNAGLTLGPDKAFYGTTDKGGQYGKGTIFRMTHEGVFTTLYSFTGTNDGGPSISQLALAGDHNLYGVAGTGGAANHGCIFRLSLGGTLPTVMNLHSFNSTETGFQSAYGPLTQANDGALYGIIPSGGSNFVGLVYQITTNGVYTPIYSFKGHQDGAACIAPLIQGRDRLLYGTAQQGGQYSGVMNYLGYGSVFGLTNSGQLIISYDFTNGIDGANPVGGLVEGPDGYFYGSTSVGGTNGFGTLFRMDSKGALSTVHTFTDITEGEHPIASLVLATDGYFYGLTQGNTTNNTGYLFRLSTNADFTVLYTMHQTNGNYALGRAPLVQGTNGLLYGTTAYGGPGNSGTIFSVNVSSSAPLSIISATYSNHTFTVTCDANPGSSYQVLYSDDLRRTNWTRLGNPVLATNSTLAIGISVPVTNFQGFYKMIQQP
jgi:uncharacterized repeat protein (TIGR03803 family)